MAKVTITVAVFLLLLTVANARLPSNLAAREAVAAVDEDTMTVLPESDSKTTSTNPILPIENPESESETANIVDWDPETTEARLTESESSDDSNADDSDGETTTTDSTEVETMESEKTDSGSVSNFNSNSVTVIRLQPINRHFARRPFPFPYGRAHRCHQRVHQHRHQFKTEGPRFRRGRDTGYGSDVILSEEGVKFERVHRDRPRKFPIRWMKFRNEVPRFKEEDTRIRSHSFGNDETRHHEHENKPTNPFMNKIRKFLNNF